MLTCAIGVIFFRYVSFYCLPIYNELEKNVLKMHVYVIVQLLHPYTFSSVWCQMLHDACRKLCIVSHELYIFQLIFFLHIMQIFYLSCYIHCSLVYERLYLFTYLTEKGDI